MPDQLPLDYGPLYGFEEELDVYRGAVADVAGQITVKELSYRLDLDRSTLAHKLANRNGHVLDVRTVRLIQHMDRERRLFRYDAGVFGFEVKERRPMTPDEERAAVQEELNRMAPDLVKIARERALGKGR